MSPEYIFMINKQNIKQARLWYSDFYDKSFAIIKPLNITKTRRGTFWFNAEIIDNTNIDHKEYNAVGSIHSYSNSFIFTSLAALKADVKPSQDRQVGALISYAAKLTGKTIKETELAINK